MGERKISPLYRLIKAAVRAVYPKIKVVGEENLPPEPVVYVGNHSQMNGPIACELYTPGEHYIWCAGEMMDKKEVPAYAYQDFWSEKPKAVRWFYKLLSTSSRHCPSWFSPMPTPSACTTTPELLRPSKRR